MHFSYGHFFQRQSFGDYGEGNQDNEKQGSITTLIIEGENFPWVLGNRALKPTKTVAYEVGINRNIADLFVVEFTGYYKDIRNTVRSQAVETDYGTYSTNMNGDYADVRGFEALIRKIPTSTRFGVFSGFLSYTTQFGISGKSGAAIVLREEGKDTFAPSGDYIQHNNPRLKASMNYHSPQNLRSIWTIFSSINVGVHHYANFPNDQLLSDIYSFEGNRYLRPPDQKTDLRVSKSIGIGNVMFSPYLEVQNLFNSKWVNLDRLRSLSEEDERALVESDFQDIPEVDISEMPILEISKYRNLPRSIVFGFSTNF